MAFPYGKAETVKVPVIASQVGKVDSWCVHRRSILATHDYSLGIVTKLSLRTSPQTGVAIRSPRQSGFILVIRKKETSKSTDSHGRFATSE